MIDRANSAPLERLLQFVERARGIDFSGYKRPSLERSLMRRLQAVGAGNYADYLDYVQAHPEEIPLLLNGVLVNVTAFFRDAPVWAALRDDVLPRLLGPKAPGEPIRAWSAGCASGQEAYSVAMLLCEALGEEAFRERAKVYATDIDEDALLEARLGTYAADRFDDMAGALRDKYFEQAGGRYVFREELRRSVVFGRHDLVQDAPMSRVDLILCRNTLVYFDPRTQAKVLARLHSALNEHGALVLGRAEMPPSQAALFRSLDLECRIFAKLSHRIPRARAAPASHPQDTASLHEQLETTSEALQSSGEELDAANAELVSANDELETMNKELQSTHAELHAANEGLRVGASQRAEISGLFQSVLAGLHAAALVVNHKMEIVVWNKRAEDLWGLGAELRAGKSLLELDGLPMEELGPRVRACLAGEAEERVLNLLTRRGKKRCRVACHPLGLKGLERPGALLLMEALD